MTESGSTRGNVLLRQATEEICLQFVVMGLLAGLVVGVTSGMVGIGGGPLIIPILLYMFKVDMHAAAGTSLAIIIPTAIVGVYSHFTHGAIDWRLAAFIALGSIVGSAFGSQFAHALSPDTLKKIFATVLLIVAISIMMDAFGVGFTRPAAQEAAEASETTVTEQ